MVMVVTAMVVLGMVVTAMVVLGMVVTAMDIVMGDMDMVDMEIMAVMAMVDMEIMADMAMVDMEIMVDMAMVDMEIMDMAKIMAIVILKGTHSLLHITRVILRNPRTKLNPKCIHKLKHMKLHSMHQLKHMKL